MSFMNDILTPERTVCHVAGVSKKRLFETIARIFCEDQPSLEYEAVFSHLIAREKLGSTGLGKGIAIPHCRVDECPQQPVDLLFALLVPGEAHQQHLDILANVARLFSQSEYCQALRSAESDSALFELATKNTT